MSSTPPRPLGHPARALGRSVVLIVGGGFGGLSAAKRLANQAGVEVILVDQRNHHLFQPLLYQVATAGLSPADIAVPIRAQFRRAKNIEVRLGQVEQVDLSLQAATSSGYNIAYDYLVLACGARHSYFGHEDWEESAPGLKTLEQATEIRRRILTAFELAENELEPEAQARLLTFVVVGAGPTGVELAGAIADISRTVLRGDFRRIDPAEARVVLVEAGPRVLPAFSEGLSERAHHDLTELGVEVQLNAKVESLDAEGAVIAGDRLAARTVIWAAGVEAERLELSPDQATDRAGRLRVGSDFSLPGFPNTFVVGDMAAFEEMPGKPLPGMAPAAIQGGRFVAETILRDLADKPRRAFRFRDKGQMATIGKSRAILESGSFRLAGRAAWLAWLFVHVLYLIGFRNRAVVLSQWAWSYFFSQRDARLITAREWRLRRDASLEPPRER